MTCNMVKMPNHPNKPEMGTRDVPFTREIYIDRLISAKKLTSSTSVWCWAKKCACVMRM